MKLDNWHIRITQLVVAGAALALLVANNTARCQGVSDINVTINGQPVMFQDLGPQQINGRTMVPVRGVLEKLGANISYNGATQTVSASTPTIAIQLRIGSRTAIVNSHTVVLDVPAMTLQDHTFVPLRFLGEALGADLRWDAGTRTVVITTTDSMPSDLTDLNNAPRPRLPQREPDVPRDRPRDRDNNNADNGPVPVIDSFTHNSHGWLRAGETLEVRLTGTPGCEASFRIPGLVEDVPMQEASAGRYIGTWQVPDNKPMQLKAAAVIGSLNLGSRVAPLLQAGDTVSVDSIPPHARDLAPEEGAIVTDPRPNISAVFGDRGSGIDQASVRLLVNGNDVTDQANVTRSFISYKPRIPLLGGRQEVELRLSDIAGNRAESRWSFIEQPQAVGGITGVRDNFDRVLRPGDPLRVEMDASPGGRATFSAGSIKDVPMREDRPGHYMAEYTIRQGDDIADQPIAYHFASTDGMRYQQSSTRTVRIATGKPLPPAITSPSPNERLVNPLVIRGTTTPFGRVAVRVDYRNRLIGLIALQGTAADTMVVADRNGRWESEPISIGGILGRSGLEYTITATAISATDEKSDSTVSRFRIN